MSLIRFEWRKAWHHQRHNLRAGIRDCRGLCDVPEVAYLDDEAEGLLAAREASPGCLKEWEWSRGTKKNMTSPGWFGHQCGGCRLPTSPHVREVAEELRAERDEARLRAGCHWCGPGHLCNLESPCCCEHPGILLDDGSGEHWEGYPCNGCGAPMDEYGCEECGP